MTAALVELGGELAGAEGASAEEVTSDIPNGTLDLGNGHKMEFSNEQFRQLLHAPEVVAALRERTQGVSDECNATRKKKRARYEVLIQNDEWTTRARGFVRPANVDARYDDAINSTMLKAAANAPNDPKMVGEATEVTDNPMPEGEDGGAEAAEGGELGELAEVAEVAVVAL